MAFAIVGLCEVEVNPLGPVHEYVAPLIVAADSETEFPLHKGLLLEATGAIGRGLITAVVDDAELVQPFTVAVTLYTPAFAMPASLITGF